MFCYTSLYRTYVRFQEEVTAMTNPTAPDTAKTSWNVPIQAITVCSTLGDFTPLRFRYENEAHQIESVTVKKVLASKATIYAGVNCLQYTCSAEISGREHIFILKYNVLSHTWIFLRTLS
jgi:hypothetical protein